MLQLSAVGNGESRTFINADFFNTGNIVGWNGCIGCNPDIADSSRYRVAAPVGNLVPIAIGYENIFFSFVVAPSTLIISPGLKFLAVNVAILFVTLTVSINVLFT